MKKIIGQGDLAARDGRTIKEASVPTSQPIDPAEMDGSLGAVFKKLVLDDVEVRRAHLLANPTGSDWELPDLRGERFGLSYREADVYWPVDPFLLTNRYVELGEHNPSNEKTAFRAILANRIEAFFDPLRSGVVIASGHQKNDGTNAAIAKAFWENSEARFHPKDSSVGVYDRHAEYDNEAIKVLWLGVMLKPRDSALVSNVHEPSKPQKDTGGRPPKYEWDSVFELLVIRLGVEGNPDSGADLARMYLDCFEAAGYSEPPNQDQAEKHLRSKYTRLWNHVTRRGQN